MTCRLISEYEGLKDFMLSLPRRFGKGEGTLIHNGRNQLRRFEVDGTSVVVKSFGRPNFINRFVYGILRPSKAKRAFRNAQRLQQVGVGTPAPVGYLNVRRHGLFFRSYLVTLTSRCHQDFGVIMQAPDEYDDVLRAVARTTARMHEAGIRHLDYGRGNILFERTADGSVLVDLIDLNRMAFGKVSLQQGCKNFERLPATPHMHRIMAETYARERGFDPEQCFALMVAARRKSKNREQY